MSFLAMLGVLLHAAALVRHNAIMLGAHLQEQALLADLQVICHSGSGAGIADPGSQPDSPAPSNSQASCPICSGLVSAVALATPELALARETFGHPPYIPPAVAAIVAQSPALVPPARGPPSIV
jgi:hypothetical protein